MKLIKAYIRYNKTEETYLALEREGFCCMTFVECEGTGQYSDQEREHISDRFPFADTDRIVKIEILVSDEHMHQVVQIIRNNARTGYRGDGMIMLSPVAEVYKVRTNEQGHLAM